MKIYIVIAGGGYIEKVEEPINFLWSYHYMKKDKPLPEFLKEMKSKYFFLDSGAFSAWTQNQEIDIYEYIDYIKANKEYINHYAALDDIKSPSKSLMNWHIMKKNGLPDALYTYHYGEPIHYLEAAIKRKQYFALGGMVPISNEQLLPWLDKIWSMMVDRKGEAKLPVHGFGLTAKKLITRYPWASVDSTAANMAAAMGKVFYKNKTLDFSHKGERTWHPLEKEKLEKYLSNIYSGITIDQIKSSTLRSYRYRSAANVYHFQRLEEKLTQNPPRFKPSQMELFDNNSYKIPAQGDLSHQYSLPLF